MVAICIAVHKNTRKRTFEYVGAEKQTQRLNYHM